MATILIIDDDEEIRSLLVDLLSEQHQCQTADSSSEALTMIQKEHYDVIITDIMMPGMSGAGLLGFARQMQKDTPVIVISGISGEEYAKAMIAKGAFDYLAKPFSVEVVMEAVRRAIEHRKREAL